MLVPALSLQKNTKEYVPVRKIDESATGCFLCPFYNTGSPKCASCQKKVYFTETAVRYVNETNRYGYKPPLKRNALLTYMYLYYLNPDENGLIKKIDAEEVAEKLHCSTRTVINNLKYLDEAGYIILGSLPEPGLYHAFIEGYQDQYRKAKEGGRGFLRIGSNLMDKLFAIKSTNMVRLIVRSYLNDTAAEAKGTADREKTINEIKHQLPEYVTKKDLLKMIGSPAFKEIFRVTARKRTAAIVTMPEFDQAAASDAVRSECRQAVESFISDTNRAVKGSKKHPGKKKLTLSGKDISDICNIALKIPVDHVLAGLQHFYQTYILQDLEYTSPGALIRTFASSHMYYGVF